MQDATDSTESSMVALLPLLLIPVVISGFFLVYALVGLVLEGDSFTRWRAESWSVAWPTAAIQFGVCSAIIFYARNKGLSWHHILNWSGIVHIGLVLLLAALVYVLSF